MAKPANKSEGKWLTELRWLRITVYKPSLKRWIKRRLSKARRKKSADRIYDGK
jgi:hypothetical protein